MNYYKHHIGDYDAATAHLSWAEDAAYSRLLRLYYRSEQPIPADLGQACRLVRAAGRAERQAVEVVLREFFRLEADGWHQKRCDEELRVATEVAERNRKNGTQGGRPSKPKPNPTETQPVISGIPNETLATSQEPLATSQEGRERPAEKVNGLISHAAKTRRLLSKEEKREAWAGKISNELCRRESPERAMAIIEAWQRGEKWAKDKFDEIDAQLRAH